MTVEIVVQSCWLPGTGYQAKAQSLKPKANKDEFLSLQLYFALGFCLFAFRLCLKTGSLHLQSN